MNKLFPILMGLCVGATLSTTALSAEPMKYNMATAKMMDTNKDGKISKDEYLKHSSDTKKWTAMDKNKDDMLDADEIKSGFNEKS